jgi:hypothetical protein
MTHRASSPSHKNGAACVIPHAKLGFRTKPPTGLEQSFDKVSNKASNSATNRASNRVSKASNNSLEQDLEQNLEQSLEQTSTVDVGGRSPLGFDPLPIS